MIRLRFRSRVALAFLIASMIVLGTAFWGFHFEFRQTLIRNDRQLLRGRARRVAKRFLAGGELRAGGTHLGTGVALFTADGTLVADRPRGSAPPNIPVELIAQSIEREGRATTETLPGGHGSDVHVLLEYFRPRDASSGIVVVTYRELDAIDASADAEMFEALCKVLPLVVMVGLLSAWIVVRSLVRPLAEIAKQAEAAASPTDLGVVTGSGAGDELDALANVLNTTFQRLREAFDRQSRFTSDAAHELRTPVAAILGRAEVALRRERTDEEYRAALTDVCNVANRAARTVEGLLHLTRLDARDEIDAAAVDLRVLLEREVASARERHRVPPELLRLQIASPHCSVLGDETLLSLLVRNLLENALTHGRSDEGVDVRLLCERAAAVLVVRDRGVGIPADHVVPVFNRLHRVDAARSRALGGAGLGLSIVRAVAEAHGGTASLASAPGAGTSVTVTLPALG